MKSWIAPVLIAALCPLSTLEAEVSVSSLFSDHMVLQRGMADPVWGKAAPGESVTVSIAGQTHHTTTGADGRWRVLLDPMEAGGPYTLTIQGENTLTFSDVLVGEVWVCSGQSNMAWPVKKTEHAEVEIVSAWNPHIRLLTVRNGVNQVPQDNFEGHWEVCTPESVADFSAIGYFVGRRLQETLGVPIGLIDNAWGGSAIEAWMDRETFQNNPQLQGTLRRWDERTEDYTDELHAEKLAEWKQAMEVWEAGGRQGREPRKPEDQRGSIYRPANLYNAVLHPLVGYGIQGFLWYQGESNASSPGRYQVLFPAFIERVRAQWGQGDFPFYWVQLADNYKEEDEPGPSNWAMMREVQTQTMDLPNTGQAICFDIGRGNDGHPIRKATTADRLVRWPLAEVYGYAIDYRSPQYRTMEVQGDKVLLSFDNVSEKGLVNFDTNAPTGFAIAGGDGKFHWAQAKIVGKDQVEVWSDAVPEPVAVRYGWANNPRVSLYDQNGLPLAPFRTDDWKE